MAPRKPAPAAAKAKATIQPPAKAALKSGKVTTWPAAEAHPHHHDHEGACCSHHGPHKGLFACLCGCCPIAKIVFTRNFWAAAVVAFIVIFTTDWFLHSRFLVTDYAASSAFWRADGEIRHSLIFSVQALTAMAYAAIIIGMGHATRWWGSFSSGMLAAAPVALCAMTSYIMLPFASPYIPAVWGIASLIQGGLAGLAICAALRASRAPECGCGSHTFH